MQKHHYLCHIQYLGFRYHGWLKQPDQLTVQKMVEKTLKFVLGHDNFKTLGGSRTDSKVSANHMVFSLFLKEELNAAKFLSEFNLNLPPDIRGTKVEAVPLKYNVINAPRRKEYLYLFSFGEKAHPFAASLLSSFLEALDLTAMQKAAPLFEGTHDFRHYTVKASSTSTIVREVESCRIVKNTFYNASFFPENTYALQVIGKGFGRYQIRMMMGQLLELGRGNVSPQDISESLKGVEAPVLKNIAPASGLILNSIEFEEE